MFKAYEHDFMSVLTHVYDCTDFSERKRGGTRIDLGAVQVNVLAAIQPAYLAELIPEIAWEQGFMSRVIMVYSGERIFKDLFAERSGTQLQDLTKRLSQIAQLYGEFTFTDEAVELLRTNHRTDWPPKPAHPKLDPYTRRRTTHILKLCMVASASENSELIIDAPHVLRAIDWLHTAETQMPEVFKSMAASGKHTAIMRELISWMREQYILRNKNIPEGEVILFLSERMEAFRVQVTLDNMVKAGALIPIGAKNKMAYRPYGMQVRQNKDENPRET